MTNTDRQPIIGWGTQNRDMDAVRIMLGKIEAYGVNHIQLMDKSAWSGAGFLDYEGDQLPDPKMAQDINGIIEKAHAKEAEVFIWVHELAALPESILAEIQRPDGSCDLSGDSLWEMLHNRYAELVRRLPELDGIIVTLRETQLPIHLQQTIGMTPVQAVEKIIDVLRTASRRKLFIRTFSVTPGELDTLSTAVHNAPADVGVMTKVICKDWHPYRPFNPEIGQFPERDQIVEFDLAGEYLGQGLIPYCNPEYFRMCFDFLREKKVQGVVGRINRLQNEVFGTFNEINIHAFNRYARDDRAEARHVWDEWLEAKYGPRNGEYVRPILEKTAEIVHDGLFSLRWRMMNYHSTAAPNLNYPRTRVATQSLAKWDAWYQPLHDELEHPTDDTFERASAQKDKALLLVEAARCDLRLARPYITEAQTSELAAALRQTEGVVRLYRGLDRAYFALRALEENPSPDRQARAQACNRELAELIDELDKAFNGSLRCGPPRSNCWEMLPRARQLHAELTAAGKAAQAE